MRNVEPAVRPGTDIPPTLPLALLESVRSHDRPGEILEDEDLSVSLPRRLGLTGVVESQIHQYQQASKKGRKVPLDDVANLFRLVLRRPDAEAIMRETGQRVARQHFNGVPGVWVKLLRLLPGAAMHAYLRRSARAMLQRYMGDEDLRVSGRPLAFRSARSVSAAIDPTGTTCVMYSGALEELVQLISQSRPHATHHSCAARGNSYCEWIVS